MRKSDALQTSRILGTPSGRRAVDDFELSRVRAGKPLRNFHKWADGRPLVSADLVRRADGAALHLLLIEWSNNKPGEYYLIVYPEDKSNPLAELWLLDRSSPEPTLSWTYTPRKRDGKNAKRVAYFRRFVGATELRVDIPQDASDVPRFLKDLYYLVDVRLRADALDPVPPEARDEFPEGAAIERLHKSRERSAGLVALVKRRALESQGRLACVICAFDFHAMYGPAGHGFMEAHHVSPLSDLAQSTISRPEDLVLVCANCHRILHRRRPWLSPSELRKIVDSEGADGTG